MIKDIEIKCEKFQSCAGLVGLENVDIKALLLQIVEKVGAHEVLDCITDSDELDLADIVQFINDDYDMKSAVDCLDVEERKELREHLNAG